MTSRHAANSRRGIRRCASEKSGGINKFLGPFADLLREKYHIEERKRSSSSNSLIDATRSRSDSKLADGRAVRSEFLILPGKTALSVR